MWDGVYILVQLPLENTVTVVCVDKMESEQRMGSIEYCWSTICKMEAARNKATRISQARRWRVLKTTRRRMLIGKGGFWKPRTLAPSFPSPSTSSVLDQKISKALYG